MSAPASGRYIGLMSGTSADGIDGVVAEFRDGRWVGLLGHVHHPYPPALRSRLIEVSIDQPAITLADTTDLDVAIGELFAAAVAALLANTGIAADTITALGSHGQTLFHDGTRGRTLQLGDPHRIAALTGITTVSDFRRLDIALGGQGAPLVPAFHEALFAHPSEDRCALNLGGIANITTLPAGNRAPVTGFDTGPANALMDEWAKRCTGQPFDRDGELAARGHADADLVASLLADPYFAKPAPKSTGRDYFRLEWALRRYPALLSMPAADVQASFLEVTVRSIADAVRTALPSTRRLIVCGGGARNATLMHRLGLAIPGIGIDTSEAHGLAAEWIEAAAFAWLAMRRLCGLPGNLPSVTGARCPAVLGSVVVPPA